MSHVVLIMPLANRFDKVSIRIPNGLLSIATLPDKAGFNVSIVDLKTDDHWAETLSRLIDSGTICVGITCSTGRMIRSAIEVASTVRKIRPDLPIVWGGPHPTLLPEQTLRHPLVDFVVINEGDEAFMELLQAFSEHNDVSSIKGIGYKKNGDVTINPPRELIKNFDKLYKLPYHLVDVAKYSSLAVDNLPSIDIFTSRGCPYNCGFCSVPLTSHRLWRAYPVERIIENIELLYNLHGIRSFYFADDNFMVDLNRVEMLLDALKEAKLDIYWGTQGVRADTINRMSLKLLDKIEESGCRELSIGVESGNPEILKSIDKEISVEDVLKANRKLAGRKIAVKLNMIIGFPGEGMKEIQKTVDLALELYRGNKNAWFPFNIFTPYPGTPMFKMAIEYGFTPPDSLESWDNLESTGWSRHYGHWLSKKENDILRSINVTSYLAFPSAVQKISNPLQKLLFKIYQPFAYFRFMNMFYFMHLEKRLIEEVN